MDVKDQYEYWRKMIIEIVARKTKGHNTMASKLRSDGQLHGQWAQGIVNWQKDYQNKLLEFVRVGMMACIVSVGGNRRWAESTKEERAGVYEAYWSHDGNYMTALFFRPVIEGIDLDGIFEAVTARAKHLYDDDCIASAIVSRKGSGDEETQRD